MTLEVQKPLIVIEDSDEDFDAIKAALQTIAFKSPIRRFVDGDEAFEFIKTGLPDRNALPRLILLDLKLPGTHGRDVLAALKSSDVSRAVPVVVMTTSDDDVDTRACYDLGANGFVTKSSDPAKFSSDVSSTVKYWFKTIVLP